MIPPPLLFLKEILPPHSSITEMKRQKKEAVG